MTYPRPAEISFREVSELLAQRISSLCDALGLVDRGESRLHCTPLNPTRNDRRAGSFVIQLVGNKPGSWDDYATGDFGDALDLVAYVLFGGWPITRDAKREAFRWSKRWLGLGDAHSAEALRNGTAKLERARAAHVVEQAKAQALAEEKLAKDRSRAFMTWAKARKVEPGTPAWTYLVEVRKIPLQTLPRPVSIVRWDMQRHTETDRVVPCLITGFWFANGGFATMHRVFLEDDGGSKINGSPAKKIWPGGYLGSFAPLWRGEGLLDVARAADLGQTQDHAYTEGIEDGLSIACLEPRWRVWAVGAGKNFADQDPPACARSVIAVRDRDPDRKVRARMNGYVEQLQIRCEERGLPFLQTWPEPGFKDFNDMLMGAA